MSAPLTPDERAGVERPQVERVHVELTTEFRVRGEHHLETTIEDEPVDHVGADATADAVARLQHDDLDPGCVERYRTRQPGETGADDHDRGIWAGGGEHAVSVRPRTGPALSGQIVTEGDTESTNDEAALITGAAVVSLLLGAIHGCRVDPPVRSDHFRSASCRSAASAPGRSHGRLGSWSDAW